MEPSKKHFEASSSFFLVYVQLIVILLSCFNLLGNVTDQQALIQFKAKITNGGLRIMESWNSSIHFCQWHGVTCGRKHRRVAKLELQFLKISGSLSPFIGNLSFLRELNLSGNNFNNQIPQEIGRLKRLETLDLNDNSISGEIPSNLSACSKLTLVYMEDNQLTAEIPASFGLLSNLKYLFLYNNSLRGRIPPSLGNLSSLETLYLTRNGLTGTIPKALGQLTNLKNFAIGGNAISGIIPIEMFNLSNIRAFDIGQNMIQGTLPSDLAITWPYVEFFSVSGNQFSGQIPVSISNASNLEVLQSYGNTLDGNVPSLEKLYKLFKLELGGNHLGQGREGDLNFLCTLVNNTKLETLSIVKNNFGGEFPECISNFSSTLQDLEISQNNILGKIPDGIGNLINLEMLDVAQNKLLGPIPFDIGRLWKLNIFYAKSNFLFGTIPHSIGNLTGLIELYLDFNNLQGKIPSNLGKCQKLLLLGLSHNNLSGSIPPEILGLSSLSIVLSFSSNSLTGQLDVSHNRLSGLLPNNLGSCVSLMALYLEGNLFEGPIPPSLSSLRGIEALDVSNNNLSGGVPEFLVKFGALKYLNLSFNNFQGVMPSDGVFKNASAIFVEGNSKLCGGIPELHLSRCNSKTSSETSVKLKIAIVVVILGVTLVFTCLLIMWFRKKKKQQPTETSIAVKVLNLLNRGASRSFLAECEALKNIRHRNLVKVLTVVSGVDYQGNDFKALVYELMENGSLEGWLQPSVRMNEPMMMTNLNFFQRVNVAIDVAHGLEYLHHHCETSIIHCDIKPSNILLDGEMIGHIGDFGLAKILSTDRLMFTANQSSSLGLRGTIGYAPPEYGMGSELLTKGDVYSYGILLLQMFTGKRPTVERFKEGLTLHNFFKAALSDRVIEITDPILLQESVSGGTIIDITLNENRLGSDGHIWCLNSIFEIGLTCSAQSLSERMDMSDVVTKLCSIRDKLLCPTR
ncbi:hypothetical protein ES332_A10G263200v1, partial [Gossypium tomentosum]